MNKFKAVVLAVLIALSVLAVTRLFAVWVSSEGVVKQGCRRGRLRLQADEVPGVEGVKKLYAERGWEFVKSVPRADGGLVLVFEKCEQVSIPDRRRE